VRRGEPWRVWKQGEKTLNLELIRLPANSQTLLVNRGVTLLAILALTYFTKTLIEAIAKLLAMKTPPQ
jgi:hypothetical protein